MRRRLLTYAVMTVLSAGMFHSIPGRAIERRNPGRLQAGLSGDISLSGAWALYPMALRWSEEFRKLYPRVRIDVQAGGAGKGMADVLAGVVDLGMVSREIHQAETEKGALPFAVCRDAVVGTLSARNPYLAEIRQTGLRREMLRAVWIEEEVRTWGELLGKDDRSPARVYIRSDACGAAETWAQYLGGTQEDLKGIGVYGDPGLAEAVRRDALGLGFNNVNFAYDARTEQPLPGIAIIPLDINGNGRLDPEEDFYRTRGTLIDAVARGAYPSPPARDLFLVSKGRPRKPAVIQFLRWVLGEGQSYVAETGYIGLSSDRLKAEAGKLEAR